MGAMAAMGLDGTLSYVGVGSLPRAMVIRWPRDTGTEMDEQMDEPR